LQVVVEPDNKSAFDACHQVRNEYCLRVRGTVRPRPAGQVNDKLVTGAIELVTDEVEVLNASAPLPLQLDEEANEEIRLRYRYLDLRREPMQHAIRLRAASLSG
jgi:aspartyl-tRNA synthetase